MKTKDEISAEILAITMKIQDQYPELSKYIVEMPVTFPVEANPHITIKILQEYYNSLDELLKKYAPSHHQT
jgi:hypothetical protein